MNTFYVYDVNSDSWGTRAPMPQGRRRGSAAVAFHSGKLYVAMGNQGGHGSHAQTLGYLDIYDPATDSWSTGPDAPNPRDHTGGAIVNDMFCIAGGRDGGQSDFFWKNVGETNCYNFDTDSWEIKPSIPQPRAGSSYGRTCDGKLAVAGGEGEGNAYNRVDVFDGDAWESPTFLKQARHGSGLAIGSCDCKNMYIASGSGVQGGGLELDSTEVYSPSGGKC